MSGFSRGVAAAATAATVALAVTAPPVAAQQFGPFTVGVQAVPAWTRVDPTPGDSTLAELKVVEPAVLADGDWWRGHIAFRGVANFEGLTMPGGELTPGAWGEGYVDRRHPHTYLHEAVLTLAAGTRRCAGIPCDGSLSLGKGFAPFGTDDPMTRPVLLYPVNHHLAQILERAVLIGAVRLGPAALEAGLFNGDEPEGPGSWPSLRRFGDSWSARLTVRPIGGIELQGSYAHVHSPEQRPGAGPDQRKWSASARWDRPMGRAPVYALVEGAWTSEAGGVFHFASLLAEGAWSPGRHRLLYRFERTERPEELRLADPFRSARPHLDNSILGVTRWTIHTVGYNFALVNGWHGAWLAPLVELSAGHLASENAAAFDPVAFYGRDTFWSVTLGARVGWGMRMTRMGRYGAAESAEGMTMSMTHD